MPASEIMVVTGRVQDLILNPEETGKITEVIAEGEYYGMRTFDQSLLGYVMEGRITEEVALDYRLQPARLQTDAGRRRPARQRHRAARAKSRWPHEGEAQQQPDRPGRPDRRPAARRRLLPARAAWVAAKKKKPPRPKRRSRSPAPKRPAPRPAPLPAKRSKARSKAPSKAPPAKRSPAPPSAHRPAPPLPAAGHAAAYEADKTVVLLVVHNGGIDDRLVDDARCAALCSMLATSPSSSSRPSRSPATRRSRSASTSSGCRR